jgi:hypothetical protein
VIRGLHLEKPGCADVDSDSMSRNWPTCGVVIEVVPCVNRMRFALVDSFGSRFVNCSDRSVKGAHLSAQRHNESEDSCIGIEERSWQYLGFRKDFWVIVCASPDPNRAGVIARKRCLRGVVGRDLKWYGHFGKLQSTSLAEGLWNEPPQRVIAP